MLRTAPASTWTEDGLPCQNRAEARRLVQPDCGPLDPGIPRCRVSAVSGGIYIVAFLIRLLAVTELFNSMLHDVDPIAFCAMSAPGESGLRLYRITANSLHAPAIRLGQMA